MRAPYIYQGRAVICVLKTCKEGMASPIGPRQALSGCPQARPGWEGRGSEGSKKSFGGNIPEGRVRRPELGL